MTACVCIKMMFTLEGSEGRDKGCALHCVLTTRDSAACIRCLFHVFVLTMLVNNTQFPF